MITSIKKAVIVSLFILAVVSGNSVVYSQQSSGELNAIQTVVPFLTIAPDSRAGGMGDAGVATSPDVYSMHWNPAKFAFIDGKGGVGLTYSPWLRNLVPDISIASLNFYKRIDSKQVISFGLLYSSLGDIEFRDESGSLEPMMIYRANEFAIEAGYSRLFTENFSGGIAFRYINSNLTGGFPVSGGGDTKPGRSFAADISGYYQKDMDIFSKDGQLSFGLNFSNIGTKMSYTDSQTADFIPMNMRLGTAGTIKLDKYNKITVTLDLNKLLVPTPPVYSTTKPDSIIAGMDPNVSVPVAIFHSFYDAPGGLTEELHEISYAFGTEYWYNDQFALRGGYFHEHESKGNRKYFTVGAGFRLKVFTIDFSYLMPLTQNHPLAHTLRFALSFDLKALRNSGK
jgi:hypothetical protein